MITTTNQDKLIKQLNKALKSVLYDLQERADYDSEGYRVLPIGNSSHYMIKRAIEESDKYIKEI